jgi:hypothetical protein
LPNVLPAVREEYLLLVRIQEVFIDLINLMVKGAGTPELLKAYGTEYALLSTS